MFLRAPSFLPRSLFLLLCILSTVLTLLYIFSTIKSPTLPRFLHRPTTVNATDHGDPFAYVFYATTPPYLCSALIAASTLRRLQTRHPIILLVPPGVTTLGVAAAEAQGLTVLELMPPKIPYSSHIEYYEDVLLKLVSFSLHRHFPHLRRIVVMDSDQLVLKSLDHLFELPSVDVAAPAAYWASKDDAKQTPGVTSALMVVETKEEVWEIVERGMSEGRMTEGMYDMDVVNREFATRQIVLPGRYCTLNSHWEAWDVPAWWAKLGKFKTVEHISGKMDEGNTGMGGDGDGNLGDPSKKKEKENAQVDELESMWHAVEVLHFTAVGKPWDVEVVEAGEKARINYKLRHRRHYLHRHYPRDDTDPSSSPPSPIIPDQSKPYLVPLSGEPKIDVHPRLIDAFRIWHREARDVCRTFWTFEGGNIKTKEEKKAEEEQWRKEEEERLREAEEEKQKKELGKRKGEGK